MDVIKAHGTGNDFVVVVDLDDEFVLSAELVQALCDRRTGVGADGVIRIGAPRDGGQVFMDHWNADGDTPQMCGNGVRVVAKTVLDRGLVPATDGVLDVATRDGLKPVQVQRGPDGRVRTATVDMGPPRFAPDEIPVKADDTADVQLEVAPELRFAAVSMGNPHAVTEVPDVRTAPVTTVGPLVEHDAAFPEGVNVEFAHVVAPDVVDLRVWERGVGETQACGTGACATLVALQARGRTGQQATIRVPGGELSVRYDPATHPSVFLTGPAVEVATATLTEGWRNGS